MAKVKHIQCETLPAKLEPHAIYFVRSAGKIIQTDADAKPVEFGGKDYWQFGFYGEIYIKQGNVPSGNDRYGRITDHYNRVVKWNWGHDFVHGFRQHILGWYVPEGYKFKYLRISGTWSNVAPNWTIYLFKGFLHENNVSQGHANGAPDWDKWLVGAFPVDMGAGTYHWEYGFNHKFDLSDMEYVTEKDLVLYMLILHDDPNYDKDTYIRAGAIIFELEKA